MSSSSSSVSRRTAPRAGRHGPATGEAVRRFQLTLRAHYISTTVGQLDWSALFVTVGLGDTGAAVRGVQYALNAHGESLVEDGRFGPLTWRAIVLPKTD